MDFELPEELAEVQKLARDFSEKEIAPAAAKDDREHLFRKDLVIKMGELGFYGCLDPGEYGGNGLGFLAHTLISEEIARVHSAIRVYLNMQAGPAVTLFEFGNEAQKKKYLPGLLSGESIGLFAITEPDAGSDVAAMKTTAKRDGNNYLLNGTKIWITNATVADCGRHLRVYRPLPEASRHVGVLCRLEAARREHAAISTNSAPIASPTGELTFDNLSVPADTLIGQEGDGFKICMRHLNHTRLGCAAGAVGLAKAAREAAVSYANSARTVRTEDRPVSNESRSDRADGGAGRSRSPARLPGRLSGRPRPTLQSRSFHRQVCGRRSRGFLR